MASTSRAFGLELPPRAGKPRITIGLPARQNVGAVTFPVHQEDEPGQKATKLGPVTLSKTEARAVYAALQEAVMKDVVSRKGLVVLTGVKNVRTVYQWEQRASSKLPDPVLPGLWDREEIREWLDATRPHMQQDWAAVDALGAHDHDDDEEAPRG